MQNQNKQMFSPPFNNGCFWTLANCKLLLLAVLLNLPVSIMVSTIARDFIDVRKKNQRIHGPQHLPDVKPCSNWGSNLNALADSLQHSCLFFPRNPGFASHLNFRFTLAPELSFDCSHSELVCVSCSATQLFAFPSKSVLQAILLSVFTLQNFRSEPTMRAARQFI